MSAPTVAELRQAIADQITASVPRTAYQVSAYTLAKPSPPFIFVLPDGITYDVANARGLDEWKFVVRAGMQYATDQASQQNLDQLISGSYRLKDILEADQTLGGHADGVAVLSVSAPQVAARDDGATYLICDWQITVWAAGI